ncbi:MAG: peptidyl-prolyl cis-trans isomerase [Pseudomonadota bacterium]
MITMFRKLMEGPGKYVFLVLIVAAFGVVGTPAISNFGRGKAVEVGDIGYTAQQVEREFGRRFQELQFTSDRAVTQEEAIAQGLLQQTIGTLTFQGLIQQEARELGLAVTDEMIQEYIRTQPVFANEQTGEFDRSRFNIFLQRGGYDLEEFRDFARVRVLQTQLDDAIRLAQPAPDTYARFLSLRQSEERDVAIAVLTANDLPELTDAELQSYYEANAGNYMEPEYRTYTLVRLTDDVARDRVKPSEEEVRQLYDSRAAFLGTPETRTFTQAQFGTIDAAQRALDAIEAGASFTEAAAAENGTVASFTDQTPSALADDNVAEAVFGSEDIGLVGPIDGVFGVVIAEISTITPSTEVTFEDVRDELEAQLIAEDTAREIDIIYDELQEAGDTGATLAEAAQLVGLDAETIGPVSIAGTTPDGETLETEPLIQDTAFSIGRDGFFEEIRLPDEGYGFVQVNEIIPSAQKPFEDVATQVALDAAADNREAALQALVDEIRLAVANGDSFEDAVAAAGGIAATRTLNLRQPAADLPGLLIDDVFTEEAGNILSAPGGGGASMTVAQVKDIRFGSNAQAALQEQNLKFQLGQEMSRDYYQAYLTALETEVGVKTNEGLLAQRFGAAP